jgi:tRNA(Ile)-lysidine synthase TilS/MesJ
MFYDASVLHIDETCFYPEESSQENVKGLTKFCETLGLGLEVVTLGDFFGQEGIDLNELILSLKDSGSCREDFIRNFRRRAILDHCSKNGVKKLLSAENGDTLAKLAFTSLIKGKGYEMLAEGSILTNFMDNPDIALCKPLKDCT